LDEMIAVGERGRLSAAGTIDREGRGCAVDVWHRRGGWTPWFGDEFVCVVIVPHLRLLLALVLPAS
jgi:hypothetical protein